MLSNVKEIEIQTSVLQASRGRLNERFLKGPIPMSEIVQASRISGKALAIYLAIRHECDLHRAQEVTVPARLLRDMGISRDSKSRCIRDLEAAGLISVTRVQGRTCRVRLKRSPQYVTWRHEIE